VMPTEPCRPDGGTIQEFIDNLPGRDGCCYYMTGVKVMVRRVVLEEIDLCIPTPEEGDPLKFIEAVMALALPLIGNTPMGPITTVQSTTPTWSVTEAFTGY